MRDIPAGHTAELKVVVTGAMTVRFDELGELHRVYATYWMAKHVEEASRKIILPFLRDDEEGIGVAVAVRHHAPARIGARLTVTARHERTEQRRSGARVHATCEVTDERGRLIGSGTTEQAVLGRAELEERLRA